MKILSRSFRRAFTLVELLVVIALIGLLSAGLGLALTGDGNRSAALQNGQSTINSLLSGARGQAALGQTEAAIFINVTLPTAATGIPEGFLREFRIARKVGTNWVVTGDGVLLPKGTAFVPPSGTAGVTFLPNLGDWTSTSAPRTSNAFSTSNTSLRLTATGSNLTGDFRLVKAFNPRGTVNNSFSSGSRIVIAPVDVNATGSGLEFKNPDFVRGARISNYGVAETINEAAGFEN